MQLLRDNSFTIIGTINDVELKSGLRRDNKQEFVTVKLTIGSQIRGLTCEYDVQLMASKLTKDNKENQLFITYNKLPEMKGQKVQVDGDLQENRYWSTNLSQMVSTTRLNGKFVKAVSSSTEDDAKFILGGFVAKTLVEKKNKSDEVYRYDITLAQSNYKGDAINMFTLHVDPNQPEIVRGVSGYNAGETVKVQGHLIFETKQVTVTDDSNAFGDPIVKTYTNRTKSFFIEGGSKPIVDESSYSKELIHDLIDAYKANDVVLESQAKDKGQTQAVTTETPVTQRQTSLI